MESVQVVPGFIQTELHIVGCDQTIASAQHDVSVDNPDEEEAKEIIVANTLEEHT